MNSFACGPREISAYPVVHPSRTHAGVMTIATATETHAPIRITVMMTAVADVDEERRKGE